MPREELLIQTFDKGIQSGADQADIENGAAAWSIDENPESIPGTVQPRLTDTVFKEATSGETYCFEKHSWITREDGKRDLIAFNAKDTKIDAITDFNGTPVYANVGTPTGTSISMNTINRAVRMGQGNNASKFVGYIDTGQFGATAPSATGLSYVNAELEKPGSFPSPYKIIVDGSYTYGIEWQGKKIYKISNAGVVTESTDTFNSLQGICDCDATYLYVYNSTGNFGLLYKILKSDLTIYETYNVIGWGTTGIAGHEQGTVSDIELSSTKMWFSFWRDGGFANTRMGTVATLTSNTSDIRNYQPVNTSDVLTLNGGNGNCTFKVLVQGNPGFGGVGAVLTTWTILTAGTGYSAGMYECVAVDGYGRNHKIDVTITDDVAPDNILFNIAVASLTTGANIVPSDVTPCNTFDSSGASPLTIGNFDAVQSALDLRWLEPAKTAFIKNVLSGSTDEIGYIVKPGYMIRLTYHIDAAYYGLSSDPGWGVVLMAEGVAKGDNFASTNSKFGSLDAGAYEVTSGYHLSASNGYNYQKLVCVRSDTGKYVLYDVTTHTFNIAGSAWDVAVGDCPIPPTTPDADTKWKDFTYQVELSKSGNMTDLTLDARSFGTSTHILTLVMLSSVQGDGKYFVVPLDVTPGTEGTKAYSASSPITCIPTSVDSTDGTFDSNKRYFYKIALEYDGYQLSPLSDDYSDIYIGGTNVVNLAVSIRASATFSARVTAIIAYRAESSSAIKYFPDSLYRFAKRFPVDITWASDTSETDTWGTKKSYIIIDDGSYGSSYENDSGVPETLPNNTMDYTISCTGAGYHFVGQAYNDELDKVANLIFRSKKNAPDTFDWSNDFCVLPTMPIALHYFKGYLYAFDSTKMYVIDTEALVLVGEYIGYGVQSDLAICSNESAMFGGNVDNIWMHDGKEPRIISYPINQIGTSISGATSHRTLASGRTINMVISPKYNSLMIAYYKYSANEAVSSMFVYHLSKQNWFYWIPNNTAGAGPYIDYTTWATGPIVYKRTLLVDYLGDVYMTAWKGIQKLCGSANGKTCTWYSKLINFGDNSTLKKVYKVIFDGTCDGYIGYDTPSTVTTAVTSGSYVSNLSTKRTTMQLKFTLTSGEILRGITLIYRKMIGLR